MRLGLIKFSVPPKMDRAFFLGVVELHVLYGMRDRGIPAAWPKLNRMRDCVVFIIFTKKA